MDDRIYRMTPEVIDAINDELEYVGQLNEQGRSDGIHHGAEGQLLTLKVYTDMAIAAWVVNRNSDAALHGLRKCAAIAVRALLTEGCPRRNGVWDLPADVPTGAYDPKENFTREAVLGPGRADPAK